MDRFGPAATFYFRQLKTAIWFTGLTSLLTLVLATIYSTTYFETTAVTKGSLEQSNLIFKLRLWIYSASIGGYAEASSRFYEANFTNITTLTSGYNQLEEGDPNKFKINCEKGLINTAPTLTYFGLSTIRSSSQQVHARLHHILCHKQGMQPA